MTLPPTIMGFFCEDIRQESDNVITLVGLMPDNINVASPEVLAGAKKTSLRSDRYLGKLCFYARANFDPKTEIDRLPFFITFPTGQRIVAGEISKETIEKAKSQATKDSLPIAGVTIRAILGGFSFPKEGGLIRLEADVNGEPIVAAILNTRPVSKITSSTSPEQPSLQSQNDASKKAQ